MGQDGRRSIYELIVRRIRGGVKTGRREHGYLEHEPAAVLRLQLGAGKMRAAEKRTGASIRLSSV